MASTPEQLAALSPGRGRSVVVFGCRSTLSVLSFRRLEQPFAFGTEHVYPSPVVASQAKQRVAQPSLAADMHKPPEPELASNISGIDSRGWYGHEPSAVRVRPERC